MFQQLANQAKAHKLHYYIVELRSNGRIEHTTLLRSNDGVEATQLPPKQPEESPEWASD